MWCARSQVIEPDLHLFQHVKTVKQKSKTDY